TIDSLGGIDVEAQYTLTDHRDGYGTFTVYAGTTHMDGDTALWYVRSRKTSSDFDRARRQQEVLKAIFLRLLSL
ncbi:MAG: LytR family transcriptional regulator, partial [candidate division Zixibacteria bacterium]|nr:LytR family transcriptional regulator [candidate division Zixibacteria bacterium]NIS47846.1 LytR family transcriptional regulator [candidate division Zixibacteria bacterium]NIU15946.1 LytR family transcriptional regulator [candidate division Zixibacteria bacterium]NIV08111.1 LytR family transcriptional regulator [candidate division Zixibacteria bacterium]NIW47358.1 LytR family transcriptional regulator [Gammaproteobacteria bacterium]